ncbi:RRQRL motif-containing zinc-binding protein [Streptomyces sp. NPDC051636]|uniref:RRQRL motif-containing zinc-binding protein n=1 Tax=Streptomyces sp. NPDC051636 TaxID=3365663 RepID=UPI0037B6F5B4
MPKTSLRYWDPEGEEYGLPTWPLRMGPDPEVLATFRQLKARGLRPGGQEAAGQLGWRTGDGDRFAYLYRVDLAKPRRPMTPAKWASIEKALRARRTCPECKTEKDYYINRNPGVCRQCDPDALQDEDPDDPPLAA